MTFFPIRLPRPSGTRRLSAAILGSAAALAAPARLPAQSAAEVQVTPETMTLGVGQRQILFATAYDRQGNLIPNARFTFYSSDTLIAKVGPDGAVLGLSPGLAKVEARIQRRRASLAVLVTGTGPASDTTARRAAPPGTVLSLDPASLRLLPGETVRLTPQAQLEDATPVEPGRIGWKSLRTEVAAVDSTGLVIGVAPGRSIIQATTSTGLMATAPVEVQAANIAISSPRLVLGPDESDTLTIVVPSQGNRPIRGGMQWAVLDSNVATVGPTGIVTARTPGRTDLVATGFGQERRVAVMVHRLAQALVVTPPASEPVQLPVTGVRRITAVAEAADSTPIPDARIAWQVGDTTLFTFDSARGELRGRAQGHTTLTARMHGFQPVVWAVEVIPGTIGLERSRVGVTSGGRDTLRALLLDDAGTPIGAPPELEWTSDHPEVARVSAGGVIEGVRPGRARITATAGWGKAASADVFVAGDVVLASNRGGRFGLYQIRLQEPGTLVPLLSDSSASVQPAISPDRTRIAFSSTRAAGSYDLFVMDADGGNIKRLTAEPGMEGEPTWTPDGRWIVYTATSPEAAPQLRLVPADGGTSRQLTAEKGGSFSPAVSPDGRTIAFISTRQGNQELYAMPLVGGEARRLTRTGEKESRPRFLPGGELVYAVNRSGGSRLMRLAPAAEDPVPLIDTREPVVSLAVSRDGRRTVYVTGRLADLGKPKGRFALFLQPLAPGSAPAAVPLRPGEQVLDPSF